MEEESRAEKIRKSGVVSRPIRASEGGFVLERKKLPKPSPPPPAKKPSLVLFLSWSISLVILGAGLQFSYMSLILLGSMTTVITTGILLLFFRPYLIERSRNNFFRGGASVLMAFIGYMISAHYAQNALAKIILIIGVLVGFWLSPILLMVLSIVLIPFTLLSISRPVQYTDLITESGSSQAKEVFIQQHGAGDEDDIYQYRIIQPGEIEKIIYAIEQVYADKFSPYHQTEFIVFLANLLSEIVETLTDPKKLAPILTDVLVITPSVSFGFIISKYLLNKISDWAKIRKNPYANLVAEKMEFLQDYFEVVPKSRISEIVISTGLSRDEAHALLRLGPFSHEKSCFWRMADPLIIDDKGSPYHVSIKKDKVNFIPLNINKPVKAKRRSRINR